MSAEGKGCPGCGVFKDFGAFNKRKTAIDGLRSRCRSCENSDNAKWRSENQAARTAYLKAYRVKTKEHRSRTAKEWRDKNLERALATGRAWREANPHKNAAYSSLRRAREIQRTPAWLTAADLEEIEVFYLAARLISEESGMPFHVDHILPLAGKLVSGLHVPTNLQLLPGKENLSKNNRWTPE